jgi:hypothetical protein
MRKNHTSSKKEQVGDPKPRTCRCGAGTERTYGKCDTPGFFENDQPKISKDLRGFDRIDLKRNNKFVVQASTYLIQGWRGNCDIQYLIYLSDTADIDASEIVRVTNYIVSYSCKGNETEVEEKNGLKDIIRAAQSEYGDERDVRRMARRVLNECSKARVISKQEASCQLAGLDLFSCSEHVQIESLSGEYRLGTDSQSNSTLLAKYAKRSVDLKHLSLYDFFDEYYNKPQAMKNKNWKRKIPLFSGARCEAVYPATEEYARAVLLLYHPWQTQFNIKRFSQSILPMFISFVKNKNLCPKVVSVAYARAKLMRYSKEPTTKTADIAYDSVAATVDDETRALVELVGTIFTDEHFDSDTISNLDFGKDHDWSSTSVDVSPVQFSNSDRLQRPVLLSNICGFGLCCGIFDAIKKLIFAPSSFLFFLFACSSLEWNLKKQCRVWITTFQS